MVHLARQGLIHEVDGPPLCPIHPFSSPSTAPFLDQPPVLPLQAARPYKGEVGGRHLEVADHHEARGVGAARDECCGVDPGVPALLQELPIPKEADQGH